MLGFGVGRCYGDTPEPGGQNCFRHRALRQMQGDHGRSCDHIWLRAAYREASARLALNRTVATGVQLLEVAL
jgi:hypothetical protein